MNTLRIMKFYRTYTICMIIGYMFYAGIFIRAIYIGNITTGLVDIVRYFLMLILPVINFLVLRLNKDDVVVFERAKYDYDSGIFATPRRLLLNSLFYSGLTFFFCAYMIAFTEMSGAHGSGLSSSFMQMSAIFISPAAFGAGAPKVKDDGDTPARN